MKKIMKMMMNVIKKANNNFKIIIQPKIIINIYTICTVLIMLKFHHNLYTEFLNFQIQPKALI